MKKIVTITLIISNILFATGVFTCSSQIVFATGYSTSSGPYNPGNVVDDATVGTLTWFLPDYAKTEDSNFSRAANMDTYATSHYLKTTNFGFSIPNGSIINGIMVEIKRKKNTYSYAKDSMVNIVKSDGSFGTLNKADTITDWPLLSSYKSYGSSLDLWGETWAPSDINNPNFGVAISIYTSGINNFSGGNIDNIRITVYYSPPDSISVMSDTMSNQTASGYSTHLIKFKTPTVLDVTSSGSSIAVAFPTDFDFTSAVITEITMKDGPTTGLENTETLAASPSATAWGAAFTDGACTAGKKCTLTLTSPTDGVGAHDIVANEYVTIAYASTHAKNATTAGSKNISITISYNSATFSIPIISSGQVTLDATVAPTITFTNDNSALHFGTLSSSAPQYANSTTGSGSDVVGNTFTISTNATSGYTLTYAAAATLTSGTNVIDAATITSSATGTAGTKQFAMDAVYTNASGGGTLTSAYNHATPNWKFNTAGDTLVTTSGPVASDTIAMHYIANISAITPAGVYTNTNTYLVAGNF